MTEIRTPEELDAGEAREALVRGIAQSAAGELIDLGDFTQYVEDDREVLADVVDHALRPYQVSPAHRSDACESIADAILDHLAARQPAPVDAETVTEWGIRHELAGIDVEDDDGNPFTEEMAREYVEDYHGAGLVSRQVTPWKEVPRGDA